MQIKIDFFKFLIILYCEGQIKIINSESQYCFFV